MTQLYELCILSLLNVVLEYVCSLLYAISLMTVVIVNTCHHSPPL